MINKRFWIYLIIINAVVATTLPLQKWILSLLLFIIFNAAYILLYIIGSLNYKKLVEANNKIDNENENVAHLTLEEYKQFKKEGAIFKDGKSIIDTESEQWKQQEKKINQSEKLQSLMEKN